MQNSHLKLDEIIWEITGECHNGCDYCGSKGVARKQTPDYGSIMKIVDEICAYPPKQIDISGGDPLLVPFTTHQKIVERFKEKGIVCKILTNPKSLKSLIEGHEDGKIETLNQYDWVGVSINTMEELELFKKVEDKVYGGNFLRGNYTIITNFNVINLYNYHEIESFVKGRGENAPWMVQFTIYNERDGKLAVYNHDGALKQLRENIQVSLKKGIQVIVSDNGTPYECGAGKTAMGILYDGSIVPCLSMRSWLVKDIGTEIQGNLMEGDTLKDIWENKFKKYRFGRFECCKDSCKNKLLIDGEVNFKLVDPADVNIDMAEELRKKLEEIGKEKPDFPYKNQVVMYAVSPGYGEGTYVYAVQMPPSSGDRPVTMLYGVTMNLDDSMITPVYSVRTGLINSIYSVSTGINSGSDTTCTSENDDKPNSKE